MDYCPNSVAIQNRPSRRWAFVDHLSFERTELKKVRYLIVMIFVVTALLFVYSVVVT